MGGLIGGYYATGLSSAEVLDIVGELNWDEVMNRAPSGPELSA